MIQALTAAALSFNADVHEYRLPSGLVVPSVTHILKAVGVSTDFEAIAEASPRMASRIDEKRTLGTTVHADCHAFDDCDLEWNTVDPEVRPYLEAWASFRENVRLVPTARERRVFHPALFFCGTLDGIFLDTNGRRILVDIKTGDPDDAAAHLQTAAYEGAYLVEHPDQPIDERWSVRLCPKNVVPYRITNYSRRLDAWRDFSKFQACVTVFHEQAARRRTA